LGSRPRRGVAWGGDDLHGLRVGIQGLGKVGWALAERLHRRGARLTVSDLSEEHLHAAAERFGAATCDADDIYAADVDVFAPCAMGAVLNKRTLPRLCCAVVAGSANNQCDGEQRVPLQLHRKGILHAPDFIINAGGLIRIYAHEMAHETNLAPWLRRIPERLEEVFALSASSEAPPLWIANELAEASMARQCGSHA